MADTPNRAYPYPGGTAAPNGPYAFQQLAEAVDADVQALEDSLTGYPHLEIRRSAPVNTAGTTWGPGNAAELAAAVLPAPTTRNAAAFEFPGLGQIRVLQAGFYSGSWVIDDIRTAADAPSYISGHLTITGGTGLDMFGGVQPIAAASTSAHFSDRYLPAGSYLFYGFQSDLNIKVRHHITLHRAL